ncbi:MAG: tetratricopeptide repeat protein [Phormidesmis sp.]
MAKRKGIRQQLSQLRASGEALDKQIQDLIEQKKYSTAIRKLQLGLKRDPDQKITVTEADLWVLQGQHDLAQSRYSQAATAFQSALALEPQSDAFYGLAKCFLVQETPAAALDLFQAAFDEKTLPKDLGGCYLKLLFLNDRADAAETLIKNQSKRFYTPHLHWAKGALALRAGKPKSALPHFKKMGRSASPNDNLLAWQVYAHQQADNWSQAELLLPVEPTFQPMFGSSLFRPEASKQPALQRLIMQQVARSEHPPSDFFDIDDPELPHRAAVWILEILHYIRTENFHNAAHAVLNFPAELKAYPALQALYRPLMLKAGDQAGEERELSCTVAFWSEIVDEPTFDPKLAVNLYKALDLTQNYRQAQQLVKQLIAWVKGEAKDNAAVWPTERLNATLAKLNCWLADCQMMLGHRSDAGRSIKAAEKLAPSHPDVLGRKGLEHFSKGREEAAIPLLTQALETGCQYREVYRVLLGLLEGDTDAVKTIRRKFGKHFGDIGVDAEVDIPDWVEALTFQNYEVMAQFVRDKARPTPALKAFQVFLDSADDEPSSSEKITLNLKKAQPQWEKLLQSHAPADQVEITKAIYLLIQQHAKRNKKGMAALQSDYLQKMIELSQQQAPEADIAHLMLLAIRSTPSNPLEHAVESVLSRSAQPGKTVALAQLELQHFGPNQMLRPFIESYLEQEPQSPLLLLAAATLHPKPSRKYKTFYDQGFDIARRLQDAEALQAFREEEWFAAQAMTRRVVGPQMDILGNPGQLDLADMIKRLARETFGTDVPPEVLAQMLPEFAAQMAGGFFMDDDEDDDLDDIFIPLPPPRRKSGRKSSRKRGF